MSTFHRRGWTLRWTLQYVSRGSIIGSYLRDTSNNEVSDFRVISRSGCANANEFVDPFNSPGYRRYHGLLIDKSPMTTALGLNFSTTSVTGTRRKERTACRRETR